MMIPISTLELARKRRPYAKFGNGNTQSERNYLDFVIDGIPLSERIAHAGYDLVSVATKEWTQSERQRSLRRLLLEEPADFPNDRRSLMVCGECGDLGCGAIS